MTAGKYKILVVDDEERGCPTLPALFAAGWAFTDRT